ncbi:hypothetical protein DINM_002430 [Dirofilaria immitis]|nr:hypothetical protein [Dirofilaria immitis]
MDEHKEELGDSSTVHLSHGLDLLIQPSFTTQILGLPLRLIFSEEKAFIDIMLVTQPITNDLPGLVSREGEVDGDCFVTVHFGSHLFSFDVSPLSFYDEIWFLK